MAGPPVSHDHPAEGEKRLLGMAPVRENDCWANRIQAQLRRRWVRSIMEALVNLQTGTMLHPSLGVVPFEVRELSADPDTQVAQTVALMTQYAIEDAARPAVQEDVRNAWRSDDPLADTWNYLARHGGVRAMQFIRDEQTGAPFERDRFGNWSPVVEALIRPVDQLYLSQPQGDCDDFAM